MPLKTILVALLFFTSSAQAKLMQELEHTVIKKFSAKEMYEALELERVIDGDTFVASGFKIRLWGIDAPEKDEPLYEISKKALELFLETGQLDCKFIDKDRYSRDVMHCLSGGKDIGALMVKTGFAKDYTKYSGGFYQAEEKYAKDSSLGIWE
jgi:endonuclease YncB( thermonuclease family)